MKKLLTLLACALFATTLWAQQALWGGVPVVSPEINSDNTVTFRLKAPKAVKVQVTGDFLMECGNIPLLSHLLPSCTAIHSLWMV